MRRTTIRIDDDLLADAKQLAARSGKTLTALIEDSLRERLLRQRDSEQRSRVELPVSHYGGGLMPGGDLDDSAGLLDLMEAELPQSKRGR